MEFVPRRTNWRAPSELLIVPYLPFFVSAETKKPIPAERLSDFSLVDKSSSRTTKSCVDLFISRLPLACRSRATEFHPRPTRPRQTQSSPPLLLTSTPSFPLSLFTSSSSYLSYRFTNNTFVDRNNTYI